MQKRDASLDIVKCICIFFVILGHTIQCFGEGINVLEHPIGKLITMFNMPLFIFVSGYLSLGALNRSLLENIRSKWNSLVLPMLIFSLVCYAITCDSKASVLQIVRGGISAVIYSYWFIYVVLYSIFYLFVVMKFAKGQLWAIIVSLFILLFVPKEIGIPHLMSFKAMCPFFIIGYLFRKFNFLDYIKRCRISVGIISAVIFVSCYFIYDGDYFFYHFAKMSVGELIPCYFLMIISGSSGIVLFLILSKQLSKIKGRFMGLIKYFGQYTFAIYMIQGVFFALVIKQNYQIHNDLVYFLLAILSFVLICMLVFLLTKNRFTSRYLLGKIYEK